MADCRCLKQPADYTVFEKVLGEAYARVPMETLAYYLMPNHWYLVLWPRRDEELSRFMAWVTLMHTQRWHAHWHSAGADHFYQERFQSFPVQADKHVLLVCRHVERNALRGNLVTRVEEWRWSSLWRRGQSLANATALLSEWLVARSRGWVKGVNEPQTDMELDALSFLYHNTTRITPRKDASPSQTVYYRTMWALVPAGLARGRRTICERVSQLCTVASSSHLLLN
ncbi:MAG: hypothetical protein CV088_21765 [Nitrospira sp. LK70]|nr:hypothetical protein [Nitrospira sp. LK70]